MAYEFTGAAGDIVIVRMEGTGGSHVAPQLRLFGPRGELLAGAEDNGGGGAALIDTSLSEDGPHRVEVSSAGGRGAFRLVLHRAAEGTRATVLDVEGRLSPEGPVAHHRFGGSAGQFATIRMHAVARHDEHLDPYLSVSAPDGTLIAEDDDGGGNLNSLVGMTLPADGTYVVRASGLGESLGRYRLSVVLIGPSRR